MHHQHLLNNMPKETLLLLATAHGDADALEALESTPEYQALAELKSPNARLSKRMSQQIVFEMRDAHEKSKIPKNVRPPVVRTKSCYHCIKNEVTVYHLFVFRNDVNIFVISIFLFSRVFVIRVILRERPL